MRMIRFLPLAYVAGVHGFALFAPYLAVFLALAHFCRYAMARRVALLPVTLRTADVRPTRGVYSA
jgi:hypothetical protein